MSNMYYSVLQNVPSASPLDTTNSIPFVILHVLFFLIKIKMINVKTMKGLDELDLRQIETLCSIYGEYSKDFLQVVYEKTNDDKGIVTGCLLYQNRFPDISNLFYLAVKPEFRNKGVGTKLINLYKKICKHITIMCIPEKSTAISFFSKQNFITMTQAELIKSELNIVCDNDDIVMMYKK